MSYLEMRMRLLGYQPPRRCPQQKLNIVAVQCRRAFLQLEDPFLDGLGGDQLIEDRPRLADPVRRGSA
jgi:hypothetical protein